MENDKEQSRESVVLELGRQVNRITEFMQQTAEADPPADESLRIINHRLAGILTSLRLLHVDGEKYNSIFQGISSQTERVSFDNLEESIIIMKSLQTALQNFYIDLPYCGGDTESTKEFIKSILEEMDEI